jgi:hypothetical protein
MQAEVVNLTEHVTGYAQQPMPKTMPPEMMRRLLGGKFPDTGFNWSMVYEFRFIGKEGTWEPYNEFGEMLPANGFRIEAKKEPMGFGL